MQSTMKPERSFKINATDEPQIRDTVIGYLHLKNSFWKYSILAGNLNISAVTEKPAEKVLALSLEMSLSIFILSQNPTT